jgi:hypothetical protein
MRRRRKGELQRQKILNKKTMRRKKGKIQTKRKRK